MAKPITGYLAYCVAGRAVPAASVQAKCLILYYCTNVNEHGTFFRSMFDICYDTRLSERTVRKLNTAWRAKGLLSWVEGSNLKKKANTYTLDLAKLQSFAESAKDKATVDRIKRNIAHAARQQKYRDKQKAKNVTATRDGVTATRDASLQHGVTRVTAPQPVYEPMHEPTYMNKEHEPSSPSFLGTQEQEKQDAQHPLSIPRVTPSDAVTVTPVDIEARMREWKEELGAPLI